MKWHEVEIIDDYPPNFREIVKAFPITGKEIFAYSHRIYNPSGQKIPKSLIEHEMVHFRQQDAIGVDYWWDKYLIDPEFRLAQETEAHVREYRIARVGIPREDASYVRNQIANRLCSSLYGNMLTRQAALKLIK